MKSDDFFAACKKTFTPLIERYGLSIVQHRDDCHVWEWVLGNATTGIRVVYELREVYMFVQLCKVIDGEITNSGGEIGPDTTINCFDIEDLLSLRERDHQFYDQYLDRRLRDLLLILEHYAHSLETYAEDVLQGNFAVFDSLDHIVKDRAREANYKLWEMRLAILDGESTLDIERNSVDCELS